jgi:nicotinamide-nucleotide adenylyltransferase
MKLKENFCGLAICRLQPFHFGHLQLLSKMIRECRIPILAIGSAQESRTYGNPFTHSERKRMVYSYYHSGQLDNGMVVPIKDIFNLGAWARYALNEVERRCENKISDNPGKNICDSPVYIAYLKAAFGVTE